MEETLSNRLRERLIVAAILALVIALGVGGGWALGQLLAWSFG